MALTPIEHFVIGSTPRDDIAASLLSLEVSFTMEMVSQITATLSDPGLKMLSANYFQLRQLVTYRGMKFEISSVETISSGDANEGVVIECRSRGTQLLRRDKGQATFGNISATQFAAARAAAVGLKFYGESSAPKGEIVRTRNDTSDESTWDVLQRLAGDLKFELFETDGILYFASQLFLLNKIGANPVLKWPNNHPEGKATFVLMELPNCRRSDDSALEATANIRVDRLNGQQLRPGMTVTLSGIHTFDIPYLVKEVAWGEGDIDPVGVSLKTPVNPKLREA